MRLLSLALALITLTNIATANDDVNLFIHNNDPNVGWAASIINACNASTTYELSCTSAPANAPCNPQTFTLTANPSLYIATTSAIFAETSALISESCILNPSQSLASCSAVVAQNGYGNHITTTSVYNVSAPYYFVYAVSVTAGAQKTAAATAACGAAGTGAAASRIGGLKSRDGGIWVGVGLVLGAVGWGLVVL